ncbi:MAG: hypothetical protein IJ530_12695 [Treponema sp.]|uniref:hypothetical protein n=1 Tax=Treponema sp. TaxID=166 RepID=UPI0025E1858D|nr:hypothetical protein [Treponema sp.]MBQ8680599.1 hypothetical protein [Treponema sp.]
MELPIFKNQGYDKFSYPIDNFEKLLNCNPTSFLVSNNGFWHNGVHFNSREPIKNICDGKIIAVRLSEQYEESGYFKDNKITPKELATLRDTAVYREKISDASFSLSFDKYFIDEGNNFILKDNLTAYEKEDAKRLLNDIFSNNFVLIEHKEKTPQGTEIELYSLFSGLRPLHRLTNKEKLDLFFYEKNIHFTEGDYDCVPITDCTSPSIHYIPCETIVTILNTENGISEIEFNLNGIKHKAKIEDNKIRKNCSWGSYNHSEIKRFQKNSTDDNYLSSATKQKGILVYSSNNPSDRTVLGIIKLNETIHLTGSLKDLLNKQVSYLDKENKKILGYIDNDLKIDNKKYADFLSGIKTGNIEERLGIINVKIVLKDGISLGKVCTPKGCDILKGAIIGYSGFSELQKQNNILVQSEKHDSTIHFEMFTNGINFLTKNRQNDNKKGNFCYKTVCESTIYTGKLKTLTETDTSVLEQTTKNTYITVSTFKLLDYERFYKVTVNANVKTFASDRTIKFSGSVFPNWDKSFKTWLIDKDTDIQLYDENGNAVENETIHLYKDFRYKKNMNYEKSDPPLRKLVYYYEKLNSEFVFCIREKDFDSLQMEKIGKTMYILKQEIPENQRLMRPVSTQWTETPKTIPQNQYLLHEQRTMSEYDSADSTKVKNHYQKVKLLTVDSSNHVIQLKNGWANAREIQEHPDLSKIQFCSVQPAVVNHFDYVDFDDWNSFFTEKNIKEIGTYKIDKYNVNIDAYKSLGFSQDEANTLIDALNFDSRIGISSSYQKFGAIIKKLGYNKKLDTSYFKNETEWIQDSGFIEEITAKSKSYKKIVEKQKEKLVFWDKLDKTCAVAKSPEKWFFNPFNFINHLNLVVENHAAALVRVQERIIKMKTIQENGPGLYQQKSETFCNHAVYLTIQALDKNYLNFLYYMKDKSQYLDEPTYRDSDERWSPLGYEYKSSNFWCDVLAQKAKDNECSITELTAPSEVQEKANNGYVVIVCWKNNVKLKDRKGNEDISPHYATVWPSGKNITKLEDIYVANVSVKRRTKVIDISTAFTNGNLSKLHFYYNSEQQFIEDYSYIETLEKRDGVEQ